MMERYLPYLCSRPGTSPWLGVSQMIWLAILAFVSEGVEAFEDLRHSSGHDVECVYVNFASFDALDSAVGFQ